MLLTILYPYIKFALGTLYPSYKTWKSLKRKDETTRRRWMKYWVSFGAFQLFELATDLTLAYILPFYIELKLVIIMWLLYGTKIVFDSIVNRELTKREKSIDKLLNRFNKIRDEIIAMVWFEISRCSVKIVTSIMSGGLYVLAQSPDQSKQTSPINSDVDEEEEEDEQPDSKVGKQKETKCEQRERRRERPDPNATEEYAMEQDFNHNY